MIVTVYHGTTLDKALEIKRNGAGYLFVTTSPFSAHHFGTWYGKPVLLKIKVPLDDVYWATTDGKITNKAKMIDIRNESRGKYLRGDSQYLFVNNDIPSKNITVLSKEEMVRKVQKESSKFAWDSRMSGDIFGRVDF